MKKILIICICFLLVSFSGCASFKKIEQRPSSNHLYWKTINAEIINVEKNENLDFQNRYVLNLTLYSPEYDITKTIKLYGVDALKYWEAEERDIISVKLLTWKNNITGTINKRDIEI